MNRKTILTLSAAATAIAIGALAIPAIAQGEGRAQMMQRMHDGERGSMQGHRGEGQMMRHGGHGDRGMRMGGMGMGMGNMQDNPVYQSFDADKDGTVTAAELETGLAALHAEYDADGNGMLSEGEFAALFAQVTRSMATRPFTTLDADGDGQISAEEMAFPAKMMARMQAWHGTAPGADTDTGSDQQ